MNTGPQYMHNTQDTQSYKSLIRGKIRWEFIVQAHTNRTLIMSAIIKYGKHSLEHSFCDAFLASLSVELLSRFDGISHFDLLAQKHLQQERESFS